jgi:hypothetical protein
MLPVRSLGGLETGKKVFFGPHLNPDFGLLH